MHKLKSKTEKVRVQFKIMKGGKITFTLFLTAEIRGFFAVSGKGST